MHSIETSRHDRDWRLFIVVHRRWCFRQLLTFDVFLRLCVCLCEQSIVQRPMRIIDRAAESETHFEVELKSLNMLSYAHGILSGGDAVRGQHEANAIELTHAVITRSPSTTPSNLCLCLLRRVCI